MTPRAVVIVAITTAACGGAGARGAPATAIDLGGPAVPAPRALPAPDPAGEPSAAAGAIAWVSDERTARERARREDRPLLVFVTAEWCVPCKEMDRGLFSDARVVRAARGAVALRIDVTDVDEPTAAPLMARIGARGVPFLQVVAPDGRETFRDETPPIDAGALERALTE